MKPQTLQKLTAMYRNWVHPRDDGGLPLSLGDFVWQIKTWRDEARPLETNPLMRVFPHEFLEAINDALDEGVSEEEMGEMAKVCVRSEGVPSCFVYAGKLADVGSRLEVLDRQTDQPTGKTGRVRSITLQSGESYYHEIDIEWEAGGSSLLKVPPERLRLVEE